MDLVTGTNHIISLCPLRMITNLEYLYIAPTDVNRLEKKPVRLVPDINCKAQGYIFALAKIGILSSLRSLDRKDQSNSDLVLDIGLD